MWSLSVFCLFLCFAEVCFGYSEFSWLHVNNLIIKWTKGVKKFLRWQITNKYMKKCPTSLISGKCKLKLQWNSTSHLLWGPLFKKVRDWNHWWGCREKGTLVYCLWECKLVQSLLKTVLSILKKWKAELLYDSAILLLCMYPKKMKSMI